QKGCGMLYWIPPLPVAPRVRGKGGQRRMLGITENTERVRSLAIRPGGVPEDAGEAERDGPSLRVGSNLRGRERKKDGAPRRQFGFGGVVELGGDQDIRCGRLNRRFWIHPDVPVV